MNYFDEYLNASTNNTQIRDYLRSYPIINQSDFDENEEEEVQSVLKQC
jgi:hypothetical protein